MSEKTTLIASSVPNPDEPAKMQEYIQGAIPLLLDLGGVIVKRSVITDTYHGEKSFTHMLVMDFPSKEALINMFDSDAYQSLVPVRNQGFKSINIQFADDLP